MFRRNRKAQMGYTQAVQETPRMRANGDPAVIALTDSKLRPSHEVPNLWVFVLEEKKEQHEEAIERVAPNYNLPQVHPQMGVHAATESTLGFTTRT